jgi:hypothetical protein
MFPTSAPSDPDSVRDNRQKNKLTTVGVASLKSSHWPKDGAFI